MILERFSILNYKNIQSVNLTLSPKINCFIGQNGVGKTNVLDAVYYLSFCKSAFTPIDAQVLRHGADFFVLEGHYLNENGEEDDVYCGMKRGTKKRFRRNKKEYKRLSEHIGVVPLVFVSPSDTELISGGSEERRRLMDVAISQYDHTYLDALNRYNKALQQRNAMLRSETPPDGAVMGIWEEQMAREGEVISAKRTAFVDRLVPIFQDYYIHISGEREKVSLGYVSHCQRGPLLDVIRRDRDKDLAVGYSLHGIHRDDLEMMLEGYQMKRVGSQGQNKTYVVALKLALFAFLRQQGPHTMPLLLLDDIFDKLDAQRVEQLVKLVSGDDFGQIFITDTNRDHLDRILSEGHLDHQLFGVEQGEVTVKG